MRNSFILYHEYRSHFKLLTQEQKAELIDAIFDYDIDGIESARDPLVQMAFSFIKADFKINNTKYDNIVHRNQTNGLKGGRPKGSFKEKPKEPSGLSGLSEEPSGLSEKPKKPKKPYSVNVSVNDSDSVNENEDIIPADAVIEKKVTIDELFESIWLKLPRKEGKKAAKKIFIRDITSPEKYDRLAMAAANYSAYVVKGQIEYRFVKHGSTFMGCWDEWESIDIDAMLSKTTKAEVRKEQSRDALRDFIETDN